MTIQSFASFIAILDRGSLPDWSMARTA